MPWLPLAAASSNNDESTLTTKPFVKPTAGQAVTSMSLPNAPGLGYSDS